MVNSSFNGVITQKYWTDIKLHRKHMPNWCLALNIKRDYFTENLISCVFFLAVEESDIIDLEKRYWLLKAQSRTGRFDLETFVPLVSPPIHASLSEGKTDRIHYSNFKRFPNGLWHTNTHTYIHLQAMCFENICSTHKSHGSSYFSRSLLLKFIGSFVIKDLQRIQLLFLANLNTDIFSHFTGLFHAFDENRDNHIDFKEISCGLSACCRGPVAERQKCKHFSSYHPLLVVHLIPQQMQDSVVVISSNIFGIKYFS